MSPRRLLALTTLALLALLALGSPAFAQSPAPASSTPGASSGPVATPLVSAAGAPAATSEPPCPNPTITPPPSLRPGQTPYPTRHPNLCPAVPNGADPFSLIAWLFTPIFQAIFLGLVLAYNVVHDIGLAILVITLVIRLLLVPVFRAQIVSQRRMQMLQPELRAIQQKYKGDRQKVSEEQMRLYRERGINPAAGCLPSMISMLLLFPMYSVFSSGLTAPNISSMLRVFGVQVLHVTCQAGAAAGTVPCIQDKVFWLGNLNAGSPEILFRVPEIGFGFSLLAFISAIVQLIQTRMMMPPSTDPQAQAQQRMFLLLPLLSLVYGSFLPSGLFIYWIASTVFSIVQQYLIAGWGSLFPLFGWTPSFAANYTPRFAVAPPPPRKAEAAGSRVAPSPRRSAEDSAIGTVRPNKARARTSRRGRRR